MQTNNEIDILISKLLSGNISFSEKNKLDEWLSISNDNRRYFDQMKNLWELSHPAFHPDNIDIEKATEKITERINSVNRKKLPLLVWWQRIAAILIIPLIALTGYLLNKETELAANDVYQEVFSPYGVRSKISLPDGSLVWLNSGSHLKYPVVFKNGSRNVVLTGEAYFEVQSDKKNPFIVNTERMSIEATGTAFNVEAYSTDTIVAVTLVHGKVGVNIDGRKNINLTPHQRISFNNQLSTYELTDTDPYKWCAWKDGILAFRDDRLDYVFKKIGLMYNVDISVMNKEIASQLYRATFQGESLEEILRLLKLSAPIRYVYTPRVRSTNGDYSKEKIQVFKN